MTIRELRCVAYDVSGLEVEAKDKSNLRRGLLLSEVLKRVVTGDGKRGGISVGGKCLKRDFEEEEGGIYWF